MKKLTVSQLRRVSGNLDRIFNLASEQNISEGMNWYKDANQFCINTATTFGLTSQTVAAVVSALSPRNKWRTNLKDTITVLTAVRDGISPEATKVSTFHCNKFKAFALAQGTTEITDDSRKTFSFVKNVGLLDENRVTVDVWHLRACFNKTKGSIGKIAYDQLESLTLKKAKKLGIKGYEYQAIIWGSIQDNF